MVFICLLSLCVCVCVWRQDLSPGSVEEAEEAEPDDEFKDAIEVIFFAELNPSLFSDMFRLIKDTEALNIIKKGSKGALNSCAQVRVTFWQVTAVYQIWYGFKELLLKMSTAVTEELILGVVWTLMAKKCKLVQKCVASDCHSICSATHTPPSPTSTTSYAAGTVSVASSPTACKIWHMSRYFLFSSLLSSKLRSIHCRCRWVTPPTTTHSTPPLCVSLVLLWCKLLKHDDQCLRVPLFSCIALLPYKETPLVLVVSGFFPAVPIHVFVCSFPWHQLRDSNSNNNPIIWHHHSFLVCMADIVHTWSQLFL